MTVASVVDGGFEQAHADSHHHSAPSIWFRAVFALIIRPPSITVSQRVHAGEPMPGSNEISQKCAPRKECVEKLLHVRICGPFLHSRLALRGAQSQNVLEGTPVSGDLSWP